MPHLNGNYIDLIIIIVIFYYGYLSLKHTFWNIFSDLISFVSSIAVSVVLFRYVSRFISLNFNLNIQASNLIGFIFIAIVLEFLISNFIYFLINRFPEKLKQPKLLNKFSIAVGFLQGLMMCIFFINLVYYLPIKPNIKIDIESSKIAKYILFRNQNVQEVYEEVFDPNIFNSLSYLTVKPEEGKRISLDIRRLSLKSDQFSEKAMLDKINNERSSLAITKLTYSQDLSLVAQEYAQDMWERKYFSHYSPEGQDVGDRLKRYKIKYTFAGENLALAPSVEIAHKGLMGSEGHRKNMLDARFVKVGVGVVDNGIYGKIFVQVFTD